MLVNTLLGTGTFENIQCPEPFSHCKTPADAASVNAKGRYGETALTIAAYKNNEVVRILPAAEGIEINL